MNLALSLIAKARHPGNWMVLTVLLGMIGLPPAVVQLLGGVLDLAPQVINTLATLGAASVAVALPDPAVSNGTASGRADP